MPRISVDVRIRPDRTEAPKRRLEGLVLSADQKSIEFRVTETQHNFVFNRIYKEDTSQPAVFSNSVQPIVEGALEGYNGCVFAYGQTGAGKTFTMSGPLDSTNDADYGIVARVIAEMFRLSFKSNDTFSFRLSVLEIYNETLFDLLLNTGAMAGGGGDLPLTAFNSTIATEKEPKLTIIELDSGVVVPNLRIMPVTSPREAINFLLDAQANRAIAEHQLNARSSRSHVIYTFYVTRSSQNTHHTSAASTPTAYSSSTATANAIESDPIVHQSKIHLVDLAGSERVHKTGSKGSVQKEANYINRSLSYLEQVVLALTQQHREHIPYRQSKLTQLLKDSLGGNCHTKLLACIWPCSEHMWETLSTLRFASRMKNVETNPVRNRLNAQHNNENGSGTSNGQGINRQLQLQVEALKKELAMRDFIHIQKTNSLSHGGNHGSVNGANSSSNGMPPSIPSAVHNTAENSWLHELTRGQQQVSSRTCLQHVLKAQQTQFLDHVPSISAPQQQEEQSVPLFSEAALMPLLLNMQSPSQEQQQQHLLEELQRVNSSVQTLSSGLPMHSLAQAQHTVQILMRALAIACVGPYSPASDRSGTGEVSSPVNAESTMGTSASASSSAQMTVPKAVALAIASWHLPAASADNGGTITGNHSSNSASSGTANSSGASNNHPHSLPGHSQQVRFLQEICNLAGVALPSSSSPVVSGPTNSRNVENNGTIDADDVQTTVNHTDKPRSSKSKQRPLLSPQEAQQAKEEAFRSFTSAAGAGYVLQRRYDEALEGLKAAKTRQKEIVVYLNTNKTAIDRCTQALQELQQKQSRQKGDSEDADDDNADISTAKSSDPSQQIATQVAEQQVLLDESKRNYRAAYQELQLCKAQIEEVQSLKQRALTAVLQAFNAFYAQLQGDDEDQDEDDGGNEDEAG